MMKQVTLSVLCLTFNQKEYIRQCLDSFLMQKTDFDFEILINDDASTDGTVEILKEYQNKYPNKIKLNLQDKNQYSIGVRNMISRFLLPKARGKYIAICEGDDYWTDPNKLQLQVDFLEKNKEYALCFHRVKVVFESGDEKESVYPDPSDKFKFTTNELLKKNFIHTNSVMYRTQEYNNIATDVMPGDWYLHLFHAQFGKIGFIDKVMSVYRRHSGGIWWDAYADRDEFWKKYYLYHLSFARELLVIYGNTVKHKESLYSLVHSFFGSIMNIDNKYGTHLLGDVAVKFPDLAEYFMFSLNDNLNRSMSLVNDRNQENIALHKNLSDTSKELYLIKSSKSWKLRNRLARVIGRKPV